MKLLRSSSKLEPRLRISAQLETGVLVIQPEAILKKHVIFRPAAPEDLFKNTYVGASLVAQWLRICLPMQGTWVRALVWEDPTCCGATRPVSHSY